MFGLGVINELLQIYPIDRVEQGHDDGISDANFKNS